MKDTDITLAIPYSVEDPNPERERLLDFVLARWQLRSPNSRIIISDDDSNVGGVWNRARARNNALSQVKTRYVVIADADTIISMKSIRQALELIEARLPYASWVLPYGPSNYYNLTQEYTESVLKRGAVADMPPEDKLEYEHKLESWAGVLVMTTAAFERVGGYDERFIGWGGEDNAFRLAMDTLWAPHDRVDGACVHLWHSAPESERFGNPNWNHNRVLLQEYTVRYGRPKAMKDFIDAR